MNIEVRPAGKKARNALSGAIDIAVEQAERYNTPLVIKRNGKVEEVSAKAFKKQMSKAKP